MAEQLANYTFMQKYLSTARNLDSSSAECWFY